MSWSGPETTCSTARLLARPALPQVGKGVETEQRTRLSPCIWGWGQPWKERVPQVLSGRLRGGNSGLTSQFPERKSQASHEGSGDGDAAGLWSRRPACIAGSIQGQVGWGWQGARGMHPLPGGSGEEGPGYPSSGREPHRVSHLPCCGREKAVGGVKQAGTRMIFK